MAGRARFHVSARLGISEQRKLEQGLKDDPGLRKKKRGLHRS